MRTILVLIGLGLLFSACSRNPGSDDPSWLTHEQSSHGPGQGKEMGHKNQPGPQPGGEGQTLVEHLIEWKTVGLSDDQIRRKTQEAADDPAIMPGTTGLTAEDAETLRKAGFSDELVTFLAGLQFKAGETKPPLTTPPAEPTADTPAADAPAADTPAADVPAGDAPDTNP